MALQPHPPESPPEINPDHIGLLEASLRAPSAHNTQPWRIRPVSNDAYELHYNQHDDLPEDPDDKDVYLTMGAFVETMALEAPNRGLHVAVEPVLARSRRDLCIAHVAVSNVTEMAVPDPLSPWISSRTTNRSPYHKEPLPAELEGRLQELGNLIIEPRLLKDSVLEASMAAWSNPRYVRDLQNWLRKDNESPDGLAAPLMHLGRASLLALELAYRKGSFKSALFQRLYASSEVAGFVAAPKAAVLTAPDLTPPALFAAGRRLLRSWVTITGSGYAYQPYSVAVDSREVAPKVAAAVGTQEAPVALYRIGRATKPHHPPSRRRPLNDVLIT